ncbi:MAG: CHAT domain-containing tetratricopeptide repeat protein, partial [Acidobacteriota bacterium]
AQAIADIRAPESLLAAELRVHRAALELDAGRLDAAESMCRGAMDLQGRIASTSHRIARTMFCVGRVRARQGRLDEAEEWMEQALDRLPPALEERIAGVANSLALVLRDKGDLERARDVARRALDSFRRLDAESMAVAGALNNLGTLHLRLEDYDRAESRYRDALGLMRRIAPDSRYVGGLLHNLGRVAQERRDLVEARRFMLDGLEHKRRVAPGTATVANSLLGLGELSYEEGRLDEAERWTREALALRQRIVPGALRCAETRILLGMILAAADRFVEAEAIWLEGLDALERANEGFRYTAQERSLFTSRFQEHYRDLASHYVRRGRIADAFDLLEHSRARALRSFTRRHPVHEKAAAADRPMITEALDLRAVRDVLDPGTRLVVFSVAEHETTVMVIADASRGADGVVVRNAPIGEDALEQQVELFRNLIERGRTKAAVENALIHHGRCLYDQLLAPVTQELAEARRLVIVPDGPLHTMPFAALVRSVEPVRWLAEWKPITLAVSATVFADAKSRRPSRRAAPRLAIYAHSRVDGESLPGVAAEARRIARRAGSRAQVWLDRSAREATLEALLRDSAEAVDILHLATHATADERSPLDSALHLAAGRGADGVLHAREIIDRFDVRSDLVVLSACNTGRGRTLASDGVLGLSHAFLFAGARSLVTSLWAIADPSTAEWMVTFYEHLDRGFTRDRALQEAQRHSIASGDHPFHWAAFQLWGDWGDLAADEPLAVTRIGAASGAGNLASPHR